MTICILALHSEFKKQTKL